MKHTMSRRDALLLGASSLAAIAAPRIARAATKLRVAKANPHGRRIDQTVQTLVMFQGVEGYITPSYYPTKQQHGKVVPTWNYAAVHAYDNQHGIATEAWSPIAQGQVLKDDTITRIANELGRTPAQGAGPTPHSRSRVL